MTYSCAIFPNRDSSLTEASRHKLDLICRRLALSPADELLEIGTVWGSLALHAAARYCVAYCEAGLLERHIGAVQLVMHRAGA